MAPEEPRPIYFFVKFFERPEYVQDFLAGRLFLNPLGYFKNVEGDAAGRADPHEAPQSWVQPENVILEFAGIRIDPTDLAGPVIVQDTGLDGVNLLCLYAATPGPFKTFTEAEVDAFKQYMRIPDQCLAMGPHSVLVRNVTEFFRRFDAAVRSKGLGLTRGPVSYFDSKKFSGSVERPMFWKRDEFAWQREYRFAVRAWSAEPTPLILDVGDLTDICIVADTASFNDSLVVQLPDPTVVTGA